ncbi:hypothetical protein RHECNPAF_3500019 [Rhizobium etli CNPAF512]|nr:hypothetical protein RHECNPAF_3500019 [Rhizobium etli CNPAF512]
MQLRGLNPTRENALKRVGFIVGLHHGFSRHSGRSDQRRGRLVLAFENDA